MKKKDIKLYNQVFSKPFGTVMMNNGRKAQIKVSLDLCKDSWD